MCTEIDPASYHSPDCPNLAVLKARRVYSVALFHRLILSHYCLFSDHTSQILVLDDPIPGHDSGSARDVAAASKHRFIACVNMNIYDTSEYCAIMASPF